MSKCVWKVILRVIYTERLNRFVWEFPLLKKYYVVKEYLDVFSYYYIWATRVLQQKSVM